MSGSLSRRTRSFVKTDDIGTSDKVSFNLIFIVDCKMRSLFGNVIKH